jgi:ATPase subunit of ABC transporter with duplicated ATPase domains
MLEIRNVNILIGTRYLIKDLSFNLNGNDKLAIIGEEGDGKSTLLKALIDNCDYADISGSISFKNNKIGYLPQMMNLEDLNKSVYNFLFYSDEDYYNNIADLYKYLKELNIEEIILDSHLNHLSGGEKIKIQILKLLLDDSDILFLDEPTNDIDLDTLKWLEEFIIKTVKPIIFVSHDEVFLERTANMILHIEQVRRKTECKHTIIRSGYKEYIDSRFRKLEKQTIIPYSEKRKFQKKEIKLNQIMAKVEHQQNTISRSDPHGAKMLKRKMRSLKSQERRLNETDLTEVPDVEEAINLFFEDVSIHTKKEVLRLKIPLLKNDNKILSKDINMKIIGQNKIVIIGKNGVGKTTLLKKILELMQAESNLRIGYMPQNYDEILTNYKTPLNFLCDGRDNNYITKVRQYLGNLKFTNEEMTSDINNLSGGTKAKLFLIKLILDKSEVLLLDEPTRNLSPLSNPVIRECLIEYNGVIISISHDRKYITEVADIIYELTEDGLSEIKVTEFI